MAARSHFSSEKKSTTSGTSQRSSRHLRHLADSEPWRGRRRSGRRSGEQRARLGGRARLATELLTIGRWRAPGHGKKRRPRRIGQRARLRTPGRMPTAQWSKAGARAIGRRRAARQWKKRTPRHWKSSAGDREIGRRRAPRQWNTGMR